VKFLPLRFRKCEPTSITKQAILSEMPKIANVI
jgi:hypothetical protein